MSKNSPKSSTRKAIAENKTVWVGIDVHRRNASLTVLDQHEVLYTATVSMEREHFDALVARLPGCTIRAVYEAGPTGYRVLRWLRDAGVDVMMTAPSMVPTRPGDYVKTDKRDSLKLAVAHRAGMLEPIWDLSDEQYDDRELLRTREQLVAQRTRVYNQVRSKLLFHGHDTPESDRWTKAFLDWLDSGPTGRPGIDFSLRTLVRLIRVLTEEIARLGAAIRRATTRPECRRPTISIPSCGRQRQDHE